MYIFPQNFAGISNICKFKQKTSRNFFFKNLHDSIPLFAYEIVARKTFFDVNFDESK